MNPAPYIGLEYGDKGRGPRFYDCWGLVRLVYRNEAGIHLPAYDANYQASRDHIGVADLIESEISAWRQVESPAPLDLVILTIGGVPCHCGVAISEDEMLHVLQGCACVRERFASPRWANRIEGFYRHRDLEKR